MKVCTKCQVRRRNLEFYRQGKPGTPKHKYLNSYCKPCIRTSDREKKYGLSEDHFQSMLTSQNGKCKICEEVMMRPHVDHNHATKEVRGLLCSPCNLALGHAGDDLETILMAALYLVRAGGNE